ncbi:D-serine dehydratase-like isoform X2 [Corticium candelabrum]|uniref:D-serine dehydratase-like isoform X2 n=1 Tax=Corticium candelabrum TaxID=121492 RepID=UPI002E2549EF|nr:D-serine dehydratase-like isoform X2 [Corticium candelabrum]
MDELPWKRHYDPRPVSTLMTPALLIDLKKLKRNCTIMRERCRLLGISLRPHMKTAKTWEAGFYMTNGTRKQIVVSTFAEATFFADGGFDDVIYAVPITLSKMNRVRELTARLESFQFMTDSMEVLNGITKIPPPVGKHWSMLVQLDVGYGRCGVKPSSSLALEIVREMASCDFIDFVGLYTHCGQSYACTGAIAHVTVASHARDESVKLAKQLEAEGISCRCVGIGSTPGCSHNPSDMTGITEYHPGNYVFYDMQQAGLGSCSESDISICVLTTVISHNQETGQLMIDCGWMGTSMQCGDEPIGYGHFVGEPSLRIAGFSQEVARVVSTQGHLNFSKYPIGCTLRLLPYHMSGFL